MILNLDNNFKPINGKELKFEAFTFSGGEPHIKVLDQAIGEEITITHRINSFNDLGLLLVAVDAIKRMGARKINLFIPYFPAARQDRVMVAGEALTVKVYSDIINKLKAEELTIFDPHSEVTSALLDNCISLNNHQFIAEVCKHLPKELLLVSPDAGALKKIHKLASTLQEYEVLECGKSRDVKTGALSGFKVPIKDLQKRDCLIVDDICDGGGTFLGLAQELQKNNAGNLYLAVSHGIFSKGTAELIKLFSKIFTTDSIKNHKSKDLITIQLKELIIKK